MSQQVHVRLTDWLEPDRTEAEAAVWPVDAKNDKHPQLTGRLTLMIRSGPCTLHLHPTVAEAQALIAALRDAIDPPANVLQVAA